MQTLKQAFFIITVTALLFSCKSENDTLIRSALSSIPAKELPVQVILFPEAFEANTLGDHEIDIKEFSGAEKQLNISASGNLFKEQLRVKVLQDSLESPMLAMIYTATSIVHTEEPISGSGSHLAAHALDVRFFKKDGSKWENVTDIVFPKEAREFLLTSCDFDMAFGHNPDQMNLSFAGDKIFINSPEYVNDRILELKWQDNGYTIFDKQTPRKANIRHPALHKLNPKEGRVGLLLGMNTKDGVKTYWINYAKDSANLVAELDYLAVPEQGGFRYIDRVRHVAYSFCESSSCQHSYSLVNHFNSLNRLFLERERVLAGLKTAVVQDDRCMATLKDEEVNFVGNGFMQVRHKISQWGCVDESPNTYDSTFYHVQPFDNRRSANLKSYYPQEEVEIAYEEIFNTVQNSSTENLDPSQIIGQKSGITFRVVREKGKVMLYAQTLHPFLNPKPYGGKNYRNGEYHMGEVPKQLLNSNSNYFPLDYKIFEGYVGDLEDVFVSPLDNVVFILTKNELRAVNHTGESVIFSLPIEKENEEKVVMVEWAVGGQVEQWTSTLKDTPEQ